MDVPAMKLNGSRYRMLVDASESPVCDAPWCAHGPTLLFERVDGKGKVADTFYACSACRDRKQCSFYQKLDVKTSLRRQQNVDTVDINNVLGRETYFKRLKPVFRSHRSQVFYCHDCDVIGEGAEAVDTHLVRSHRTTELGHDAICLPTKVLDAKQNNKVNAQFFFSESTVDVIISCLQKLHFTRIICIGTPRLHEEILSRSSADASEGNGMISSFLLDIDSRFRHFYGPDEFAHYNMFNHHFFAGAKALDSFMNFCAEDPHATAVVVDPPYGGMVEALKATLLKISQTLLPNGSCQTTIAPCFLIFPYYLEPQVVTHLDAFCMQDYRVGYDNHAAYCNREAKDSSKHWAKSSPARIFTNLSPESVELPAAEGYRFCPVCRRYVSQENKHCTECNACTTKHGPMYVHCAECRRCVKPSWMHCSICNRCVIGSGGGHLCGSSEAAIAAALEDVCFKCGQHGHKRSECSSTPASLPKRHWSGSAKRSKKLKQK